MNHGEVPFGVRPTFGALIASRVRRFVQARVWGMDIHETAWIDPSAYIDRTWPRGIHVGPASYIGEQAVVLTHDFTRGLYLDTRIGARSYVGARAVILPGLTIGNDCVVMPGTLVTKDMAAGTFAIGNPADYRPRTS